MSTSRRAINYTEISTAFVCPHCGAGQRWEMCAAEHIGMRCSENTCRADIYGVLVRNAASLMQRRTNKLQFEARWLIAGDHVAAPRVNAMADAVNTAWRFLDTIRDLRALGCC